MMFDQMRDAEITPMCISVSVASSAVKPRNWASFHEALREKFSGSGLQFFGLFLAIPFRYFGLVFGVTTSVEVSDVGVLDGGRYRR